MALLSCPDIYNSRNIAMYGVFPQHLLDLSPILNHMALYISRAMEAMIDHIISQKPDQFMFSNELAVQKANLLAECLRIPQISFI